MDKPIVSVIMPAFNAVLYISEAIESVINQTFRNWELIIINDGSTDATEEIVLDFERKDKRIKYLFQENGKQGKARNLGIANSIGEYIAFLDADDLWVDNKLATQVNYLIANHKIDLIFSQGYLLEKDKLTDFDILIKPLWTITDIPLFIEKNQIPILSVVVKKTCLIDVDNFSEDLNIQNVEDYHLWIKLLINQFKFTSISDRLFYYRIHSDQNTFNNNNTFLPIVRMFRLLHDENKISNWEKNVIIRLKWILFDSKAKEEATKLIIKLLNSINKYLALLMILTLEISSNKIRTKIIFKIASLV
ncbi:glycosyltransferase family 2 protein [Pedobacter sp. N23S346]|uniref:glycosyltransferase family 2 protein n=1 Tax=Pedobacter sp. N23S346 TaxID=3402750 RepID=UPI003ACF2CD0